MNYFLANDLEMCPQASRYLRAAFSLALVCGTAIIAAPAHTIGSSFGSVIQKGALGFDWNDIHYFYAFGDSYTFVQGTDGLANFRCVLLR